MSRRRRQRRTGPLASCGCGRGGGQSRARASTTIMIINIIGQAAMERRPCATRCSSLSLFTYSRVRQQLSRAISKHTLSRTRLPLAVCYSGGAAAELLVSALMLTHRHTLSQKASERNQTSDTNENLSLSLFLCECDDARKHSSATGCCVGRRRHDKGAIGAAGKHGELHKRIGTPLSSVAR